MGGLDQDCTQGLVFCTFIVPFAGRLIDLTFLLPWLRVVAVIYASVLSPLIPPKVTPTAGPCGKQAQTTSWLQLALSLKGFLGSKLLLAPTSEALNLIITII